MKDEKIEDERWQPQHLKMLELWIGFLDDD